ncbi:hypothetical protein WN943_005770 [Citrus x changshan-huyou]
MFLSFAHVAFCTLAMPFLIMAAAFLVMASQANAFELLCLIFVSNIFFFGIVGYCFSFDFLSLLLWDSCIVCISTHMKMM